jgi:hypothetical protein
VLVHPAGGSIPFDIDVDDVGMDGPWVRVVTAAATDNRLILSPDVEVAVGR